jgi:hypothetical protein
MGASVVQNAKKMNFEDSTVSWGQGPSQESNAYLWTRRKVLKTDSLADT